MKIGDLVKYYKDGSLGVIAKFDGDFFTVLFSECVLNFVTHNELEIINESR